MNNSQPHCLTWPTDQLLAVPTDIADDHLTVSLLSYGQSRGLLHYFIVGGRSIGDGGGDGDFPVRVFRVYVVGVHDSGDGINDRVFLLEN